MDEETETTDAGGDHRFAELSERWASLSTTKQEALLAVARTWGPDAEDDEDPWRRGVPDDFRDLLDEADADAMRRATSRDERLLIATHALLGLGYDSGLREAVDDRLYVVHDEVAEMLAVLESSYSFDCSLVAALATLKADLIGFDRRRSEEDRAILRQWTAGLPKEILDVLPPDDVVATFAAPSDPGAGTAVTRIEASMEAIVEPIRHARNAGQSLSLTDELANAIRALEDAASAVGNQQWMADLRKILDDDLAGHRPDRDLESPESPSGPEVSILDPRLEQWQDGLPQVVAEGMDPASRKTAASYPQISKRVVRAARALIMDQDVESARRFVESASLRRIKAIRAITPALDAITPQGKEWRDVIRVLDGALNERKAFLEATDPADHSPDGQGTGSPPEEGVSDWAEAIPETVAAGLSEAALRRVQAESGDPARIVAAVKEIARLSNGEGLRYVSDRDLRAIDGAAGTLTSVLEERAPLCSSHLPRLASLRETIRELLNRNDIRTPGHDEDFSSEGRVTDPTVWDSGIPVYVRQVLPVEVVQRLESFRERKDRLVGAATELLKATGRAGGDGAVEHFSVAVLLALMSVCAGLRSEKRWGRASLQAIESVEPAIRVRLGWSKAQEGSKESWKPMLPKQFLAFLDQPTREAVLKAGTESEWFRTLAHSLGFQKRLHHMPVKFEEQDSEWMEAVERLIGLAETSSVISALPESGFVQTYLETESKRLEKRQKALRNALREVPVGDWRDVGPLKASGYRVDAVRPLSIKQRREKLRDLLWVELDFLKQMDRDIHRRAGEPRSSERRTWMASYLRNNINLHGSRPRYEKAVAKWEQDLDWLLRQRVR